MTDITHEDVAAEMSGLVRRAAEPCGAGESVGALVRRAARRLRWPHGRTKRLWYGEARSIPAHEADTLRARAEALDTRRLRDLEAEYARLRQELEISSPRLARLAPPALGETAIETAPEGIEAED